MALACLAGAGFAASFVSGFAGFAATDFFAMGFLTLAFAAGFAGVLRAGNAFLSAFFAGFAAGFVFAAGFFAIGFGGVFRATRAAACATALPFAGDAFAVFARLTGFALLFAIPKPIL